MKRFLPEKIVIENGCENDIIVKNILKNLPSILIKYSETINNEYLFQNVLILKRYKGDFFKKCPCSPEVICCGYYVLMNAENCYLNCTYCFLHKYVNGNAILIYTNIDEMFDEIDKVLNKNQTNFFRVGTGEFSDSLALDDITEFSKIIVPFFSKYDNALLELKTKSININNLLDLEHKNRTVVSWSINPDKIIFEEESSSPLLDERLESARICASKGYRIGLHFDPIIYYQGWENDYKAVVKKVFDFLSPDNIIWISLGSFRYVPELKSVIRDKFPKSKIIYGEHILSTDGKMKYIKPIRLVIYRKMLSWIREYSKDVFVYLCMETKDVWGKVFNLELENKGDLEKLFPQI